MTATSGSRGLAGGTPRRVTDDESRYHFLTASADDARVRGAAAGRRLLRRRRCRAISSGGRQTWYPEAGTRHLDGPEYSPDGAWLYVNTEEFGTRPGHAQRALVMGGRLEQLVEHRRLVPAPVTQRGVRHLRELSSLHARPSRRPRRRGATRPYHGLERPDRALPPVRRLSGDQLLTLIVPWPPNRGSARRSPSSTCGPVAPRRRGRPDGRACRSGSSCRWRDSPSGDRCGNQSTVSDSTSCSRRPPSAGTRASWAWPGRVANSSVLTYSHAPSVSTRARPGAGSPPRDIASPRPPTRSARAGRRRRSRRAAARRTRASCRPG